jgi:predicted O-methyltransferase YrrM
MTTVEFAEHKIGVAVANFTHAGLTCYISMIYDESGRVLERSADSAFDLAFLDANLRRVLRLGGLS